MEETVITHSFELHFTGPGDRWGHYKIVRKEVSLDDFLWDHSVRCLRDNIVYDLHPNAWRKNKYLVKVVRLDGTSFTLNRLIELRRLQEKERLNARRLRNWRYQYRRQAWRGHRGILRTTQEIRWAHAWDDEENAPRVRAARNGHNLPNMWDDPMGHNEKSWKYQSKRRHQWRPN
jgi:hypothetical protein